VLLSLLLSTAIAAAPSIRSLTNVETIPLNKVIKPKTVVILFQAGCASCRQQMKDLDCLKGRYEVVLLGAFSTEAELRKEHRKYHPKFKSYYASKDVLKHLKITEMATPQIMVYQHDKVIHSVGLKACSKIVKD
jgi:hypothetical protein